MLTKDWELGNVTFRPNCNNITYNGQPCTSIRTTTRINGFDFSGDTALYCSVNATRADVEAEYARINRPTDQDHNTNRKCAPTPLTKALKSLAVARAYVAECQGKLADARKGQAKEADAEKWPRLSEQHSPIYKWTAGGLPKVQSCPRRRWSLATNRPTRWATRGAPELASYAASFIVGKWA